jgi:hypothetical protein
LAATIPQGVDQAREGLHRLLQQVSISADDPPSSSGVGATGNCDDVGYTKVAHRKYFDVSMRQSDSSLKV